MELHQLRAFRAVCEAGSISAAAARLGYTQSAVSRQIAALEGSLGASLVERHARGVRPTAAGAVLLDHTHAVLARLERAGHDVRSTADQPANALLRVGAVPTAAAALLPAALADLTRTAALADPPGAALPLHTGPPADHEHPEPPDPPDPPRVTFVEAVTPELLPRLADHEIDVAVITDYPPGLPADPGLDVRHVADDPLHCALPLDHRLAGRTTIDLVDLADETWVEDNAGAAAMLRAACARAGFDPRIDIRCGGWLGKQSFVAAGFGVTLVPGLLVPALRSDLAIRPLRDPPRRGIYVACRAGEARNPLLDGFLAALARSVVPAESPPRTASPPVRPRSTSVLRPDAPPSTPHPR